MKHGAFFFLKACKNPIQAQHNNNDFTYLRQQQQFLTSIHRALKVTADVIALILY